MERDKIISMSCQITGWVIFAIGGIWAVLAWNEISVYIYIIDRLGGSSLKTNFIIEVMLIPVVLIVVGLIILGFGTKIVKSFIK